MAYEVQKFNKGAFLGLAKKWKTIKYQGVKKGPRGLDVIFLLDTTGSMSTYLKEVRENIVEILGEIDSRVPDSRVGIVVYKDHGDEGEDLFYLVKGCDFSTTAEPVIAFIRSPEIRPGRGGGGAEAVECALRKARTYPWRATSAKAIVLIGDKPPHGGGMDDLDACPRGVDYREEVKRLKAKRVTIYSVQVDTFMETERVFSWISDETGGKFLRLKEAKDIPHLLVGICLKETETETEAERLLGYERELQRKGLLTESKRRLLLELKK